MSEPEEKLLPSEPRPQGLWVGRILFPILAILFIVDVLPWTWTAVKPVKKVVNSLTSPAGIWQNEWALFAPNPVVANSWITADVQLPDGSLEQWQNTYWADASAWERFANFRMLNYTNRVQIPSNYAAADDLAESIARQYATDLGLDIKEGLKDTGITVTVYSNGASLVMPEDGSLPTEEEQTWVAFSNVIGRFPIPVELMEEQEQ